MYPKYYNGSIKLNKEFAVPIKKFDASTKTVVGLFFAQTETQHKYCGGKLDRWLFSPDPKIRQIGLEIYFPVLPSQTRESPKMDQKLLLNYKVQNPWSQTVPQNLAEGIFDIKENRNHVLPCQKCIKDSCFQRNQIVCSRTVKLGDKDQQMIRFY